MDRIRSKRFDPGIILKLIGGLFSVLIEDVQV
mgnify:CR=1 FL=1